MPVTVPTQWLSLDAPYPLHPLMLVRGAAGFVPQVAALAQDLELTHQTRHRAWFSEADGAGLPLPLGGGYADWVASLMVRTSRDASGGWRLTVAGDECTVRVRAYTLAGVLTSTVTVTIPGAATAVTAAASALGVLASDTTYLVRIDSVGAGATPAVLGVWVEELDG